MNEKLTSYILQQKLLKVSCEEIKKTLISRGWNEKEIDAALNPPSKKKNVNTLQILTITGNILVFLGLLFNLIFVHPYNAFFVDQSVKRDNDILLAKIEYQEEVLHNVLHSDLMKGNIPISKELSILFRLSHLQHMQNELMKITDTIATLNNASVIKYNPIHAASIFAEIKNTQTIVAAEVNDQTHDGTLDPSWFVAK
ncbi:MAG: hypothetical protein WAV51_01830 [Microgenomates group bacterium]